MVQFYSCSVMPLGFEHMSKEKAPCTENTPVSMYLFIMDTKYNI